MRWDGGLTRPPGRNVELRKGQNWGRPVGPERGAVEETAQGHREVASS